MGAMWHGLARLIELALTPLFLLLSWLASLLPAATMPGHVPPPARPPPRSPDLDALAQQQTPPEWIPWLAAALVLVVVLFVAAGILRWLLQSELVVRAPRDRAENTTDVSVERTGGAVQDVRQLMRWLGHWLRSRLGGRPTWPARAASGRRRGGRRVGRVPRAAGLGGAAWRAASAVRDDAPVAGATAVGSARGSRFGRPGDQHLRVGALRRSASTERPAAAGAGRAGQTERGSI